MEEFSAAIELGQTSPEAVQAAKHMVKIVGSLSDRGLENIVTCLSLVLANVLINMDFECVADRDRIPPLFGELVLRNMALIDEHDRAIGSRA